MSASIPMTVISPTINVAYNVTMTSFDINHWIKNGQFPYVHSITQPPAGFGTLNRDPNLWDRYQYNKPFGETGTFSVILTVTDANNETATGTVTLVLASAESPPPTYPTFTVQTTSSSEGTVQTSSGRYRIEIDRPFLLTYLPSDPHGIDSATVIEGFLPLGLSISRDSISGTPISLGARTIHVSFISSITGAAFSPEIYLDVVNPSVTITTSYMDFDIGVSHSVTAEVQGGTAPYTWVFGTLPDGLTASGPTVSGVCTAAAGSYPVEVTVTDVNGLTTTRTITIAVRTPSTIPPDIANAPFATVSAVVGATYNRSFYTPVGLFPYTWTFGGLPPGLTALESTISGTYTTAGTYYASVTVTAADGGTDTEPLTFIVSAASASSPVISNAPFTSVSRNVGDYFNRFFTATGGTSPYTWSYSGLPPGVTPTLSIIGGTFTTPGTYTASITVTDAASLTDTETLTFVISDEGSPFALANDTATTAYQTAVTINVLQNDSGSVSIIGITQPTNGVSLVVTGGIRYTPNALFFGTDTFTYTGSDGTDTATATVTVTVNAPGVGDSPVITNATTPISGDVGDAYTKTYTATGGVPPYTWAVINFPPGLSVSSAGVHSGTFSQAGTFSVGLAVTDSQLSPNSAYATVEFNISEGYGDGGALTVTPVGDITLFEGDEYSGKLFTVAGGSTPFRTAEITITTSSYLRIRNNYGTILPDGFEGLDTGTITEITYTKDYDNVFGAQFPPDTTTPFDITAMFRPWNDAQPYIFRGKGYYIARLTLVDGSAAPGRTATAAVKFIVYGLDGSAPDPDDDPGDPNNPPPVNTATIQGTLRLDTSDGAFAARDVYLYDYVNGEKIAETVSDGTTGAWQFTQVAPGEYFVVGVAHGEDLNIPRDFDALGVITVV